MRMKNQIIKAIRKNPILLRLSRLAYGRVLEAGFIKNMFSDPKSIKKDKFWYEKVKSTQLEKERPLFLDRQEELKKFFGLKDTDLIKLYLREGLPSSYRFKRKLVKAFDRNTYTELKIKKAYGDASLLYTLRLMLGYERYSFIMPYLDTIKEYLKRPFDRLNVLDYGCGVSDIGLLFMKLGAKLTLADLDDKKFNFTAWRFEKRGLRPDMIRIMDTGKYPKLEDNRYDIIIATEILEHVRNPLELLKNLTSSLKKDGLLFDSLAGEFEKEVRGDHLKEAVEIGKSKEYQDFYKKNYSKLSKDKKLNFLFRVKK